jgi:hypothetical protein
VVNVYKSTCCNKVINLEEYILNHGMCNACMDKGLKEACSKQKEAPVEFNEEFGF